MSEKFKPMDGKTGKSVLDGPSKQNNIQSQDVSNLLLIISFTVLGAYFAYGYLFPAKTVRTSETRHQYDNPVEGENPKSDRITTEKSPEPDIQRITKESAPGKKPGRLSKKLKRISKNLSAGKKVVRKTALPGPITVKNARQEFVDGKYALNTGDPELAMKLYTRSITGFGWNNPESVPVYIARSELWERRNNPYKVAADLSRAIEMAEKNKPDYSSILPDAYARRAKAYKKQRRYHLAAKDFTAAIEIAPSAELYRQRGVVQSNRRDYKKAVEDFTRSIELKPDQKGILASRGYAYRKLRKYNEAIADFTGAIEKDPGRSWVYYHRGRVFEIQKNCTLAVSDFSKAIELKPKSNYFISRANCNNRLGLHDQAFADYAIARKMKPKNLQAYLNPAMIYEKLHQYDQALDLYEQALKIRPGSRSTKRAIERIRKTLKSHNGSTIQMHQSGGKFQFRSRG